jgi:outer membrane protein insertion porin family
LHCRCSTSSTTAHVSVPAVLPGDKPHYVRFNTELGYGNGYGDKPYPFFKNFYLGGIGSVRGFEAASLGPRDVYGDPLGGTRRFSANFEALVPIPGADKTLRAAVFLDAGQVWGPGCNGIVTPGIPLAVIALDPPAYCSGPYYGNSAGIDWSLIRYSVGVGIAWISPMGPLRLSYAYPLNAEPWDRVQRFQFQIGTGF